MFIAHSVVGMGADLGALMRIHPRSHTAVDFRWRLQDIHVGDLIHANRPSHLFLFLVAVASVAIDPELVLPRCGRGVVVVVHLYAIVGLW